MSNSDLSNKKEIEDKKKIKNRIIDARKRIIIKAPFFGSLLMQLKIALASCETACTDMKRIIFDPEFANRLSDDELEFVLRHEVMHCVLKHCIRGNKLDKLLYNIAADIVVNSNIMKAMGISEFMVDGEPAMHIAPDGSEGYKYTAEEVYYMLLKKQLSDAYEGVSGNRKQDLDSTPDDAEDGGNQDSNGGFDSHSIWDNIEDADLLENEWDKKVIKAANGSGLGDVPPGARKLIEDLEYETKLNWRTLLNDFIQVTNDTYDYTFSPVDKRYSGSEFILPSFNEIEGEKVDNIWFVVDTSGSMSDESISHIFSEIKVCLEQFEHLSGLISFFDTRVSEPVLFEDLESLSKVKPVGGGGTNFGAIFKYMRENMASDSESTNKITDKLPTAIIILTDGYALFPAEEAALGIPVLWIITDSDVTSPWGTVIHI